MKIEEIATQALREIMLDSQIRLDEFFFGPEPLFPDLMLGVRTVTVDREEQMVILLSMFASKDYNRIQQAREQFVASILEPRAGEVEH